MAIIFFRWNWKAFFPSPCFYWIFSIQFDGINRWFSSNQWISLRELVRPIYFFIFSRKKNSIQVVMPIHLNFSMNQLNRMNRLIFVNLLVIYCWLISPIHGEKQNKTEKKTYIVEWVWETEDKLKKKNEREKEHFADFIYIYRIVIWHRQRLVND